MDETLFQKGPPPGRRPGSALEEAQFMRDFFHQELFLTHLLIGDHYDEAKTAEIIPAIGIDLEAKSYLTVSVEVEKWGEVLGKNKVVFESETRYELNFVLMNLCGELFSLEGRYKVWSVNYRGRFHFILGLPEETADEKALRQKAAFAVNLLEEEYEIYASFAFSDPVASITMIGNACKQTDILHEYRTFLSSPEQVIFSGDLSAGTDVPLQNRIQAEDRLLSAIRAMDTDGVKSAAAQAFDMLLFKRRPSLRQFTSRRIYAELLIYDALAEMTAVFPDAPQLDSRFVRLSESAAELLDSFEAICDALGEKAGASADAPKWVYELHEYVAANYADPDLNVNNLADRWGIGSSYCTKVFRACVGMSLFEYIQRCRVAGAVKLLGSGLNLKAIAERSGFSSPINMNRAFRRYEGVTPRDLIELRLHGPGDGARPGIE